MREGLSRLQIGAYVAIGIAVVLLGIRAMRGDEEGASAKQPQPVVRVSARDAGDAGRLTVHVAGAVRRPGVYRLPVGSRVADAVERAGGPRASGDENAINLAAPLADGQQVAVPAGPGSPASASAAELGEDVPISLGAAEQSDLEEIDGIGPVTAADIIEFREQSGGIASISELEQIPGIGPATIEMLSDSLQP